MAREDGLKDQLVTEYRTLEIEAQEAKESIVEAQAKLQEAARKMQALMTTIKQFGWEAELHSDEPLPALFDQAPAKKGKQIADAAATFLRSYDNEWIPLSNIFVVLANQGIQIGGKNPASTLSAHLSNSGLFESDRSKGWRLKKEHLSE